MGFESGKPGLRTRVPWFFNQAWTRVKPWFYQALGARVVAVKNFDGIRIDVVRTLSIPPHYNVFPEDFNIRALTNMCTSVSFWKRQRSHFGESFMFIL